MKILGRGKPAQPAPVAAVELPERLSMIRLRITVATPGAAPPGTAAGGEIVVEAPSRVEEIDERLSERSRPRLIVTAPEVPFVPSAEDLAAEHVLVWLVPDGQMEVPVRIQDVEQPLWPLIVTGPARKVQRRQYVRVPLSLPGDLTAVDPDPDGGPGRWAVTLLDVSEGGVRCLVPGVPPPEGAWITIRFESPDAGALSCRGVVVQHLPTRVDAPAAPPDPGDGTPDDGPTTVAIRFDDPEEHGNAIRRLVFAEQLRQRQLRLDA